ncbi:MAG: serine/threonine-protein kinase [Nannocystaceae bacterium]
MRSTTNTDGLQTESTRVVMNDVDRSSSLFDVRECWQQRIESKVHARLFDEAPVLDRIGRYTVLEEIGRGGMGTVYSAYDEQLGRKVALKVLRDDELPTEEGRLRLRREAQALARLSHANVVTIHEVGIGDGRMYLAMEFIQGQSLDQWLRSEPAWPEVLDAMVQAGRGLAAAHAADLVHRDFKLLNVMRAQDGVVKVLDFGLVREAHDDSVTSDPDLPSSSDSHSDMGLTLPGRVMGTPSYMSPEQHRGVVAGPQSDQYSFCIAVWESLSGSRPFGGSDMRKLAEAKLMGPPSWPSRAPSVGRRIVDALRRGLSPEPGDRWPSMDALLEALSWDPRRRRNRWWAGLGVLGALSLGGALQVGAQVQQMRCSGAEASLSGVWDETRRAQVEEGMVGIDRSYAVAAWERTDQELSDYADAWATMHTQTCEATTVRAEQSAEVMDLRMACLHRAAFELSTTVDVLADADDQVVRRAHELTGGLPPLSRCADVEALQARVPPPEDPAAMVEVEALREQLQRYRVEQEAGRYVSALEGTESVVARAEALGYAPLVAEAKLRRGMLRSDNGHYAEAEQDLRQAYAVAIEQRHDEVALDAVTSLVFVVGHEQARHAEGRVWGETALAHARLGRDDRGLARVLDNVGAVLSIEGEYEQAKQHFERALRLHEQELGSEHPAVARSVSNLGTALSSLGDYAQAKLLHERALRIQEAALGPEHPEVADSLVDLGIAHHRLGEYEQARLDYERALRIKEAALGPEHPDVAACLANLCSVFEQQAQYEEARDCHERALQITEQALGPDHPIVANGLSSLGIVLFRLGEYEPAKQRLEQSLEVRERVLGPDHPDVAVSLGNLGGVLKAHGDYEHATQYYERALTILEEELGPDHPEVAIVLSNLGTILYHQAKDDEARPYLERALRIKEQALGPDHPRVATSLSSLGNVLTELGEHEQARDHHERSLQILETSLGPDNPKLAFAVNDVGTAQFHAGEHERAKASWTRAVALWEQGSGIDHVNLAYPLTDLAKLALDEGDFDAARAYAERAVSIREDNEVGAALLATTRFVLARAWWPKRSQRRRAYALAVGALDLLVEHAPDDEERAQIERWLSAHRVRQ